ncbi:antigenic A10 [Cryptosporidium sp. chipmunk genotype I]|uniref:antigenic A10 n=1 Tax=Cryptosporidium sp. chipmunk genotype I TaxID=1280935 RepID=UPI00351A1090|nr:antigenic A10 [Cryptosporidium sp. chipmunk genotype I]
MEIIRNLINIYLKKFLHLEDLKWDINQGLQVDHVKANSQCINKQFEEKGIPIQIYNGTLDSMKITYSPASGTFQIHIKEINAQIKPRVLSTVGKKIQQGIVNIILDEDPIEFIDSYSYIRDLPISYLEQASKKSESCIVDPDLIPDPPRFPTAALKIKQPSMCPPKCYPPLHFSIFKPKVPMVPVASTPLMFQNRHQEYLPSSPLVFGPRNQSVPILQDVQSQFQPCYMLNFNRENGHVKAPRESGFCI